MPDTNAQLRHLIGARLDELDDEAKALERALRELGGRTSARPKRADSAPRRRRSGRVRRGQRREQLLAALAASPGSSPSDLASEIGISPSQVSALLGKAKAEKLVKKVGSGYELRA